MEFLAKLPEQLATRVRTLSLQRRTAAILFCLAIVVGVLFFANGSGQEKYEALFDGRTFSYEELAAMTTALHEADLLDSRTEANQILVPQANKSAYMVALQSSDAMPPAFDESVDEAVANPSLFATAQQTEMSYRHAEQKKLARIVASLNGIESASVQYGEVKKPGFPPSLEIQALVAVRAVGGRELDFEQVEAIRDTVAGYVAGLDRAHVTVTDLVARRAYPGSYDRDGVLGASNAYAITKRIMESELRAKIQRWLEKMCPAVVVGVDVHLQRLKLSPQTAQGDDVQSEDPLVPSRVTASIGLPKSYPTQVWRERTRASGRSVPVSTELDQIKRDIQADVQQAVMAMLPPPQSDSQDPHQVAVTFYEDAQTLGARQPAIDSPESDWLAEHKLAAALGLFVLVGGVLCIGWKYRTTWMGQLAVASAGASNAALQGLDCKMTSENDGPRQTNDGPRQTEANVRNEIKNIVRQNPEAAAELIRKWLDDAA